MVSDKPKYKLNGDGSLTLLEGVPPIPSTAVDDLRPFDAEMFISVLFDQDK